MEKLGVVFCPENNSDWMVTHAANPVAEPRSGSLFRIYFTSRDKLNRSSIGWLDLDMRNPFKILTLSEKPIVSPGKAGLFDDSGAAMGCLTLVNGKKFLYYLGWNLGVTVPWRNSLGLAVAGGVQMGPSSNIRRRPSWIEARWIPSPSHTRPFWLKRANGECGTVPT